MQFSVRAQMGIQYLISLLKFMLTTLKMIHTHVYNKRWKQNLRRNEGRRRKILDSHEGVQRQQQEREEPENPLQKVPQSKLR